MDLLLDEGQILLRDAARRLGAKAGPRRARELRDAGREIDRTAWSAMVEAGWLAALVPENQDGLGLGLFDLALALEETGRQIVMAPLVEGAAAIWAANTAASPSLDRGAMALTGAVSFVAFAPSADLFLVTAQARGEAILCLVRRETPGLAIATTPNVDGSTSSTLTFSRVAVAERDLIARGEIAAASGARMHELLVLGTSAELLGVAQAALDVTLQHTRLREQFGKKIGSYQALQHRLVDCYVEAELNRSLLFRVLSAWDANAGHPAMVSAVKARLGKGALKTVRLALQLHGAIGYTDEHDIGVTYKRAVALAAKYGNEITHVGRFSGLTLAQRAAE